MLTEMSLIAPPRTIPLNKRPAIVHASCTPDALSRMPIMIKLGYLSIGESDGLTRQRRLARGHFPHKRGSFYQASVGVSQFRDARRKRRSLRRRRISRGSRALSPLRVACLPLRASPLDFSGA